MTAQQNKEYLERFAFDRDLRPTNHLTTRIAKQ